MNRRATTEARSLMGFLRRGGMTTRRLRAGRRLRRGPVSGPGAVRPAARRSRWSAGRRRAADSRRRRVWRGPMNRRPGVDRARGRRLPLGMMHRPRRSSRVRGGAERGTRHQTRPGRSRTRRRDRARAVPGAMDWRHGPCRVDHWTRTGRRAGDEARGLRREVMRRRPRMEGRTRRDRPHQGRRVGPRVGGQDDRQRRRMPGRQVPAGRGPVDDHGMGVVDNGVAGPINDRRVRPVDEDRRGVPLHDHRRGRGRGRRRVVMGVEQQVRGDDHHGDRPQPVVVRVAAVTGRRRRVPCPLRDTVPRPRGGLTPS